MDIGKFDKEIIVEPLVEPVYIPEPAPVEPQKVPVG